MGALRIHDGVDCRTVGVRQVEILLVTLLIRGERDVSVEELVYKIWGESNEKGACGDSRARVPAAKVSSAAATVAVRS
jgi:DNA-binding SARP family transcriptional activator